MSSPNPMDKKSIEQVAKQFMPCPTEAVFTLDQTEKIVEISTYFDREIAREIASIECKLEHLNDNVKIGELENKLKCIKVELCEMKKEAIDQCALNAKFELLNSEIEQIVRYDELNKVMVSEIKKGLENVQCELNSLECRIEKFDEKVAINLLSQAEELERMEKVNCVQSVKLSELQEELCQIRKLVVKNEVKDAFEAIKALEKRICALEHLKLKEELMEHIACLEKKIYALEHKVLKDERVDAILSMMCSFVTKEAIEEILCQLKKLECKEMIDHRVDEVLKRLCALEKKEIHDERVDVLIKRLCMLETKEEAQELLKRIAALEAKEMHDARVDLLLHEICEINKHVKNLSEQNCKQNKQIEFLVEQNCKQHKQIETLSEQNCNQHKQIEVLVEHSAKQHREIECLNEKLNRNTLVLDSKIDNVERKEVADTKVNFDQNAAIKFLQTEIVKMNQEIERLQKALLVAPVCH